MNIELYWVTLDKNSFLSSYTQDNKFNQDGWYRVAVDHEQLPYFKVNYSKIKYENGVLVYPKDYERSAIEIDDDTDDTPEAALQRTLDREKSDVQNAYDPKAAFSKAPYNHQSKPIYDIDFTEPLDWYQIFDSYNYQLTPEGLILTSYLDPNTGICQPARLRTFGIPLKVNQYAITTLKVPDTANSKGVDFSFWYFNTNHAYGYSGADAGTDFDNDEFDVDEIHNGQHYLSLYDWKRGNTFKVLDEHDDAFYRKYHTFAIRWTNNYMSYYLDGFCMFSHIVSNISDTMFPTWEIEAPMDGRSSTWGGGLTPNMFPSHAIVKNYQVFNI